LQEEFDESLARLETREADLSKSYDDDGSDDESGDDEVCSAGGALGDLASELARAEEEMRGQALTTSASEIIDTSAVAQAAAAKALAKRKQTSGSEVNPRALVAIPSWEKSGDDEDKRRRSSANGVKEATKPSDVDSSGETETVKAQDPEAGLFSFLSWRGE